MDNRRMSARAEAGASRVERVRQGQATSVQFLDKAVELTRANWEILLFAGIMLLAIFTRLWDLMPRAMHHDESIHAYFSNYYLHTGDYTTTPGFGGGYDPTYHGPFLYTVTALSFLLFGTTEATARLMPALFGILLVGLCWLLRPFIGRAGALIAAGLLLISPSITYYSRALRHDIFALTGAFLLFISILWFLRTHQARWVYLGAVGLVIAYASHELTFIVAFIFVAFLAISALTFNAFSGGARYSNRRLTYDEDVNPVRSALAGLATQRWTLIGAALLFVGIYVILFSNFLTKPDLIFSGIWEGLRYWFLQHGEARGNQPLFYYTLLMPIYEPLALFAGLGTVIYLVVKWIKGEGDTAITEDNVDVVPATSDALVEDDYGHPLPVISAVRGLALGFLAFWAFGAYIAFSIAGEKMPWLNMQIALPFSLLAAAGLGQLIANMEWREVRRGGGLFLGVGVILFIFSAFMLVAYLNGSMPRPAGAGADLQNGVRGVLLFLFTIGLLALCGWLAYKMLPGRAVKLIGFTFAILLAAYGVRSMVLSSYQHSDVPTELLVYTQSAPDTVIVSDLVKRLSRDTTAFDSDRNADDPTGGNGLTIALDQNDAVEWPFDWYFRDMRHLSYFNTAAFQNNSPTIAPNTGVIIASEATENEANFKTFIQDKYTTNKYVLNWWFPEMGTYKNNDNQGDLGMALKWLTSNGMKYILYRDPGLPLGSRNFYLHVRNDLAGKTGLASAGTVGGTTSGTGPTANGPTYDMLALAPTSAEKGAFSLPRGITTGPEGSFYVVDTANMRVQKFDSSGKFLSIIGNGKGTDNGMFNPFSDTATGTGPGGVAVDKQGNIYVADTWNHRIQKFDSSGKFVTAWGAFVNLSDATGATDPDKNTKFFGPRGIAIGPDGNVYVTDTGNKRVSIFTPDGKFVREISSGVTPAKTAAQYAYNQQGEMNEPVGIAVAPDGSVYVADSLNKRIQKFDAAGKFAAAWPIPGTGWDSGAYLEPFIALDSQGNVYASEPTGAKVIKFSPAGQVLGEKGTSPNNVTLKNPTGITIGKDGNVYVVDTGANGVVKMGTIP